MAVAKVASVNPKAVISYITAPGAAIHEGRTLRITNNQECVPFKSYQKTMCSTSQFLKPHHHFIFTKKMMMRMPENQSYKVYTVYHLFWKKTTASIPRSLVLPRTSPAWRGAVRRNSPKSTRKLQEEASFAKAEGHREKRVSNKLN